MRLLPAFLLIACVPEVDEATLDDDRDGLTNEEEAELGTDPSDADSDADGWLDNDEVSGGTNPLYPYSHPFEQGDYLVGTCPVEPDTEVAGATGTGSYGGSSWTAYQEGDVLANFVTWDSYEQEVTPYAFCGNYTLITESAVWCGPCQALAAEMAEDMEKVRSDYPNFIFFEFLYQDNSGGLSHTRDLENWRDDFGLDGIPVVAPESENEPIINELNATGGIPSTLLVAPDMTVIWSGVNHPDEYYLSSAGQIKNAIEDYEEAQAAR